MIFGESIRNYPLAPDELQHWGGTASRPAETFLVDMLVLPGSRRGLEPKARVFWGDDRPTDRGPEVLPLAGKFEVQHFGRGPDALATPEVPNYPSLARAAVESFDWNLENAAAWRLAVQFPRYQTQVRIRWDATGRF